MSIEPHPKTAFFLRSRLWFWVVGAVFFLWFIARIKSILLPFVVGIMAAYFLDPAVRRLRTRGWSRGTAAAAITAAFFALAVGLCIILVPLVTQQFLSLLRHLPDYIAQLQTRYGGQIEQYIARLDPDQVDTLKDSLGNYGGTLVAWAGQAAGSALKSGLALLSLLSLIFITPIVVFYLLRDWYIVVERFFALLPRDQADIISGLMHDIDLTLSSFIRGQTNVCLIFACYYGIALSLLGLHFGLLIGIMTGLLLFIPFVGIATCLVLSLVVALFEFPDTQHVAAVLAVYIAGMALEGSVITPRLVGGRVGLHPLWIIFGMLAGGALLGFLGILISVPVTAIVGVLVRFAISYYLKSSLYIGEKTARQ